MHFDFSWVMVCVLLRILLILRFLSLCEDVCCFTVLCLNIEIHLEFILVYGVR